MCCIIFPAINRLFKIPREDHALRTTLYGIEIMLPILTTKFNVPSLHGEIVHRRRLIERLFTNPYRKLTLISAPPG
jgi:hypothetical protein